jgi:hypothetical protein
MMGREEECLGVLCCGIGGGGIRKRSSLFFVPISSPYAVSCVTLLIPSNAVFWLTLRLSNRSHRDAILRLPVDDAVETSCSPYTLLSDSTSVALLAEVDRVLVAEL